MIVLSGDSFSNELATDDSATKEQQLHSDCTVNQASRKQLNCGEAQRGMH